MFSHFTKSYYVKTIKKNMRGSEQSVLLYVPKYVQKYSLLGDLPPFNFNILINKGFTVIYKLHFLNYARHGIIVISFSMEKIEEGEGDLEKN